MDKYVELAMVVEVEKMTITTLSDALNEGGLPAWDRLLAAYKAGEEAKAGHALFSMIDDYLVELAEEAAPEFERSDKEDYAMDELERRAEYRQGETK